MQDPSPDPYAPPKTDVNQAPVLRPSALPDYFVISSPWVIVLPPLTFGIFAIYWAYRQWHALKTSGEKVNPLGRGIFLIFFIHALFRQIHWARTQSGLTAGRAGSGMATAFVILTILANIAGRAGASLAFLATILLTFFSSFILSLAQDDINELSRKVGSNTNRRIGVGGIIVIVLSAALFLSTVTLVLRA